MIKHSQNYLKTNEYRQLYSTELRMINKSVIEKDGGLLGEKDSGMIEYVCEKPFQEYYGQNLYETLFEKASTLFYSVVKGHYFLDGNKRTACMALFVFLGKNGYELDFTEEELFDVAISVATDELSENELVFKLIDNCIEL